MVVLKGIMRNTEIRENKDNNEYMMFDILINDDVATKVNVIIPAAVLYNMELSKRDLLNSEGMEIITVCRLQNYIDIWKTKEGIKMKSNKTTFYALYVDIVSKEVKRPSYELSLNL